MTLQEIYDIVKSENIDDDVILSDNLLIIKKHYEMTEYEKNSDDCCDVARELGEEIILNIPNLEIANYYCHRNKYSIVELQIKN